MKKIISLLTLSFFVLTGFSQQDSLFRNKSGKIVLPQEGDFAVGISVNPIFSYFGNMLSSSGNNQLNVSPINDYQLSGKYFLSSQNAIRMKLGLHQSTRIYENNLIDDLDNSKQVTDKLNYSFTNFSFSVGYERRTGSSRLQVSYGTELNLYKFKTDYKYTYGNSISIDNQNPTSTYDFETPSSGYLGHRKLENKKDNGIQIGIRAFTSIEYFIFAKISIGGEIGLEYSRSFNGNNITTTEYWDFMNSSVKTDNDESEYSTSYINSDMLNGQMFLLFHF
jgi:hypothetical protein